MNNHMTFSNKTENEGKTSYTLSYNFIEEHDEYNIIDVVREKEFYNLLFQLNPDIIKDYNVIEKDDYKESVCVTINIGNDDPEGENLFDDGEEIKLLLDTTTKVYDADYATIYTDCVENNENNTSDNDSYIEIKNVSIIIKRVNSVVNIDMIYSIDYDTLEYIKEFTNLFIKKLFHRLICYFEGDSVVSERTVEISND